MARRFEIDELRKAPNGMKSQTERFVRNFKKVNGRALGKLCFAKINSNRYSSGLVRAGTGLTRLDGSLARAECRLRYRCLAQTTHNIYSCQKFFIYVKIMACYSYPDKTWIRSQWGRLQERTGALCLGIRIF